MRKLNHRPLYYLLFLIICSIALLQITFTPPYANGGEILLLALFALSAILGLFYLFQFWVYYYKETTWIQRIQLIGAYIIFIYLFLMVWVVLLLFASGQSTFKESRSIGDQTIYWSSNSCDIPDTACECDYFSQIYRQNRYLPLMHFVTQVDFYVGNVRLEEGMLIITPDDTCPKDGNKIKRVAY
ncbi:MAG: hypothetical protein ACRBFS_25220 [Aureispira sp.]